MSTQFEIYRENNTSRSTSRFAGKFARIVPLPYDRLDGKVAVVTGVTQGGIGFEIAKQLAQLGANVYCAGRTEEKVRASIDAIDASSGGPPAQFLPLDLSSLAGVRAAATDFLQRESALHILVNNAGGADMDVTEDGYQGSFGVNYLGPFLFTDLLLNALRTGRGRVVNVSSLQHNPFLFPPDEESCVDAFEQTMYGICVGGRRHLETPEAFPFHAFRSSLAEYPASERSMLGYGAAKAALVLHARELGRREPDITAIAVCPGLVNTSMMDWFRPLQEKHRWDEMLTVAQGAAQPLFAALQPGLNSGSFWSDLEEETYANPITADPPLGSSLWEYSQAAIRAA